MQRLRRERQAQEASDSIRVKSERLDKLVNLIGELVTVQARLSQLANGREDPERLRVAAALQHALLELDRDPTMTAALREGIGYDGWIVGDDRRYDAIRKVHQRFGHYRFGATEAAREQAGTTGSTGETTEAPGER